MRKLIIDEVDHRHLNHDVPMCQGVNPTTENLAILFWHRLLPQFGALLGEVRLYETDKNWVSYFGEAS